MDANVAQARELIRRCRQLRDAGKIEAVLRSEFVSHLRVIFASDDDVSWINQYSVGTEAHIKVGTRTGKVAARFIDNLVGATSIEYESDLRIRVKRETGYRQVREHAVGVIRKGTSPSQIRGLLSDFVEWYAYEITLAPGVDVGSCTPEDITLSEIDALELADDDEDTAERLIAFIRRHLARQRSRPLTAEFLSSDLGLESGPGRRSIGPLTKLVLAGRKNDRSILLATNLWSGFVDHLESDKKSFRVEAYADEVYLCVLARLLSANVLANQAILSETAEIKSILDGSYFLLRYQLNNLVEADYFGWLTAPAHIDAIVPMAREIQRDLYAYDFSARREEDLFGRLMAELARRSHRKLLGQEWTHAWLAKLLAERCIDNLPKGESPRIVDMCCGSGSMLAEVLKAARQRLKLKGLTSLSQVVTGFDIDPLAVSLSKTTWIVTLAAEIKAATGPISIPVFHADSLFAATPRLYSLPLFGDEQPISVPLDGKTIELPHALMQPLYRELFDRIVYWAHDEASAAQEKQQPIVLTNKDADRFLMGAAAAVNVPLPAGLRTTLVEPVKLLANRIIELTLANRNSIWSFILRNTYRPALFSGQFNGLVSNPPWLALSAIGNNPYKNSLRIRAKAYGIMPRRQSFLHAELGTTHLLHAIDRYLAPDSSIACLVPGKILDGTHHEPFRRREFLTSERRLAFELREVWKVAEGTFKYPGAAVIGVKRSRVSEVQTKPLAGAIARPEGLDACAVSVKTIGPERSVWVLQQSGGSVEAVDAATAVSFQQGADLMPRTTTCIEILSQAGAEYRVNTPSKDSQWRFTVKAPHELKKERFPGHVAPRFIWRMAQSENLLPFLFGEHRAPIALPADRDSGGAWRIFEEAEIRKTGLLETARRFAKINSKLAKVGVGTTLQQRINLRRKLSKQVFGAKGYLLVAPAGGKHICAACLPVKDAKDLVIDQTLYWKVIESADAAWYLVGMLNSRVLTKTISPFNPKGAFSERHIHTLPYKFMPRFDPLNADHVRLAKLAREVAKIVRKTVAADSYLNDPMRAVAHRRTKLRRWLGTIEQFIELEAMAAANLEKKAFSAAGATRSKPKQSAASLD